MYDINIYILLYNITQLGDIMTLDDRNIQTIYIQ